jgi:16S rRNA (cytosine967-C5)-methyltransferase
MSKINPSTFHAKERPHRLDARDLAVQVLLQLENTQSTIQSVLNHVLKRTFCKPNDVALCTELCYGALRMEIRLRWLLDRFLPSQAKLPPRMRCILLVAAYALLFLDSIPSYAIVDWAADSVKRSHGHTLARVANGCLRAICREGVAPREYGYYLAAVQDDLMCHALYYSLPLWIAQFWVDGYGHDAAVLLFEKSASRPAAGFRVNRSRPDWMESARLLESAGAQSLAPGCLAIAPDLRAHFDTQCSIAALVADGKLSRQSAASQLALDAMQKDILPEPIWDACAGQGTKSCALLESGNDLRLVSDVNWSRLRRFSTECRRLQLRQPTIALASALQPPLRFKPSTIILDVPCSGLGVLSSRPDLRRRNPKRIHELIEIQAAMLGSAFAELSSGGQLVYITCTVNPSENENLIRSFLSSHSNCKLAIEWSSPFENSLLEGMYSALLVKR